MILFEIISWCLSAFPNLIDKNNINKKGTNILINSRLTGLSKTPFIIGFTSKNLPVSISMRVKNRSNAFKRYSIISLNLIFSKDEFLI